MAAAALGEKLLAEVNEENLSELLRDVRANGLCGSPSEAPRSYPYPYLGIKPLDELLQIFQFPHALQSRHRQREGGEDHEWYDGAPSTDQMPGRRRTRPREPVIEITSPSSGDGKTSLLYYITAIGILPPAFDGVTLGGKGGAVVFLDTDSRFDAKRLRDILVCIVREKLDSGQRGEHNIKPDTEPALGLMIDECLRHVHVFRPQSSLALLSTLRSLESYLLHSTQHVSHARRLHAIILDSASAFYWQDRREAELLSIPGVREERAATATSQNPETSSHANMNTPQIALETVNALRHLQHTFSCAILYSTWGLQRAHPQHKPQHMYAYATPSSSSASASPLSFRPHLPRPWPTFPTLRLVVHRDPVRQFAPYMSIDEARRDASARQGVVARGEFSLWVDLWGKDNWPPEIMERLSANNILGFWVRNAGVGICGGPADGNDDRA